jgi:hypothetical protein
MENLLGALSGADAISTDTIANRYWEFRARGSSYHSFERTHGQPAERNLNRPMLKGDYR